MEVTVAIVGNKVNFFFFFFGGGGGGWWGGGGVGTPPPLPPYMDVVSFHEPSRYYANTHTRTHRYMGSEELRDLPVARRHKDITMGECFFFGVLCSIKDPFYIDSNQLEFYFWVFVGLGGGGCVFRSS